MVWPLARACLDENAEAGWRCTAAAGKRSVEVETTTAQFLNPNGTNAMTTTTPHLSILALVWAMAAVELVTATLGTLPTLADVPLWALLLESGLLLATAAASTQQRPAPTLSIAATEPAPLSTAKPTLELSPEQRAAVAAAKRIVARAREKFLAAAPDGRVPDASEALQKHMALAADAFERNLDEARTAEGEPWTLQYESKSRGIRIHSAKFPGHACMRWKVSCVLPGDLESAYDAVFEPEKRRVWDSLVNDVKILSIYECRVGDGLAVTLIKTNAAAGGLVSSRTMLDLALQRTVPDGGINIANCSCPDDFPEFKQGPAPGSDGRVRAWTHVGSGCSIKPIPGKPGFVQYVLVSTLDLKGWLSAGVINAAMTQSLALSTKQMQDFLAKKSGGGAPMWS